MSAFKAVASVSLVLGSLANTAAAVNIETVTVGDPGNVADSASHSGNPAGQGSVAYRYSIGKYEATAGQYCEFLNKVAATDTYGLYNTSMADTQHGSGISRSGSSGSYAYSVNSAFVNRPVNYVSYWDALRFTNWLSNGQPTGAQGAGTTERGSYTLDGFDGYDGQTIQRNPGSTWAVTSEDEWYKAAYYKGGSTDAGYFDYPTSSNGVPGRDLNDASGNNANYFGSPHPIQSTYYTTEAAEFQNSGSPYGTFDQGGNVWEWNEVIVYQDYPNRGLRGGSFNYNDYHLHASNRSVYDPAGEENYIGFRVSLVPEPAAMMVLAFGGVGMLRRKRP